MENISLKTTDSLKHFNSTPEIHKNYSDAEKQKLAKASKEFESMLAQMMLKSMTSSTEGLFGSENFGGDVLDTVFEGELASYMTESKSLGISEMIYRKLTGESIDDILKLKGEKLKGQMPSDLKDVPSVQPTNNTMKRLEKYEDIILEASEKYGIHQNVIKSIILTESAANERAVSKAKAKGLMQLMDPTAKEMGVSDSMNPRENIMGGTKYFAKMLRQYNGNMNLALAAYNAGPGNVEKYNGIPPFDETKKYINRVLGYLNNLES